MLFLFLLFVFIVSIISLFLFFNNGQASKEIKGLLLEIYQELKNLFNSLKKLFLVLKGLIVNDDPPSSNQGIEEGQSYQESDKSIDTKIESLDETLPQSEDDHNNLIVVENSKSESNDEVIITALEESSKESSDTFVKQETDNSDFIQDDILSIPQEDQSVIKPNEDNDNSSPQQDLSIQSTDSEEIGQAKVKEQGFDLIDVQDSLIQEKTEVDEEDNQTIENSLE